MATTSRFERMIEVPAHRMGLPIFDRQNLGVNSGLVAPWRSRAAGGARYRKPASRRPACWTASGALTISQRRPSAAAIISTRRDDLALIPAIVDLPARDPRMFESNFRVGKAFTLRVPTCHTFRPSFATDLPLTSRTEVSLADRNCRTYNVGT